MLRVNNLIKYNIFSLSLSLFNNYLNEFISRYKNKNILIIVSVEAIFNGINFRKLLIITPRRLSLRQFLKAGHVFYAIQEG